MGDREIKQLSEVSELKREQAVEKYKIIQPHVQLGIPLSVISNDSKISQRTLQNWVQKYNAYGLKGLVRKKRTDSGSVRVSNDLIPIIEDIVLKNRRISITSVHRKIEKICIEKKWDLPSYHQVYSITKSIHPSLKSLAQGGKKAYQNQYDLVYRRESSKPNEIWQADHTLLDIWLLDAKSQPARPWLTIVLDDYSRAIAGYFLSFDAPSARHTSLALHQAIWRKSTPNWHICGIPEILYTDHGSDFTSKHLEQVCIDLKINLIFSSVGKPRGRGKIERMFLTVNQMFLQELPGYIQSSTDNRKAKLTLSDFEKLFLDFICDYHSRQHGTTKIPPQKRWEETGFLPNMPESLENLDLLLLQVAKARKVQTDGIRFQGLRYIDPLLAAYVGENVVIRYNPRNLSEIRVFYNENFLCNAICPELSSCEVDLDEIVTARKTRLKQLKKDITDRTTLTETILSSKSKLQSDIANNPTKEKSKLKRYINE